MQDLLFKDPFFRDILNGRNHAGFIIEHDLLCGDGDFADLLRPGTKIRIKISYLPLSYKGMGHPAEVVHRNEQVYIMKCSADYFFAGKT